MAVFLSLPSSHSDTPTLLTAAIGGYRRLSAPIAASYDNSQMGVQEFF
jgi:hypothetical protein